jgi:hypothetical protein
VAKTGRGKSAKSIELIDACIEILREIQPASTRAVCYQLFNRKLISSMAKNNTNRVGRQLVYAREHALIPWSWIVDEAREAEYVSTWADPGRYADLIQGAYRRDRWAEQPRRVEVWSEKGTVRGTLAALLRGFAVTLRVFHGYNSATVTHDIADETDYDDEPLVALYIGDYDPSGLHMSEVDLPSRLDRYEGNVEVVRVGLTQEDVIDLDRQGLTFSTDDKRTDPRYAWFTARHGNRCAELDALSPALLRDRVRDAIEGYIDWDAWFRAEAVEKVERQSLFDVVGRWRKACAQNGDSP